MSGSFSFFIRRKMPGLIVNELLTISLKYAFPERHGEITIDLRKTTSEIIQLIVKDGVGQTKDEHVKGTGFGKKLIELLTQQLDGTMKVVYSPGTQYFFEFNR